MNEIQVFKNENFGEIRVAEVGGEPWFCASDVCRMLGYYDGRKAVQTYCKPKGVSKRNTLTKGGNQQLTYINEGNLYRLITHSKLPSAEQFETWVFDEVLPSIRKHGAYMSSEVIEKTLTDPDFLIKLATELKNEKQARLKAQKQIELQAPKVQYYDEVLTSQSSYTVTQIAKELGLGPSKLNQMLHEKGVQYKQNGSWIPYFKYQDKGFVHSETLKYKTHEGKIITKMSFKWTEKGRQFIHKLLNKAA